MTPREPCRAYWRQVFSRSPSSSSTGSVIGAVEDYAQIGLDTSAGALLIFGQDGNPAVIERDLERMAATAGPRGATSSTDR